MHPPCQLFAAFDGFIIWFSVVFRLWNYDFTLWNCVCYFLRFAFLVVEYGSVIYINLKKEEKI